MPALTVLNGAVRVPAFASFPSLPSTKNVGEAAMVLRGRVATKTNARARERRAVLTGMSG